MTASRRAIAVAIAALVLAGLGAWAATRAGRAREGFPPLVAAEEARARAESAGAHAPAYAAAMQRGESALLRGRDAPSGSAEATSAFGEAERAFREAAAAAQAHLAAVAFDTQLAERGATLDPEGERALAAAEESLANGDWDRASDLFARLARGEAPVAPEPAPVAPAPEAAAEEPEPVAPDTEPVEEPELAAPEPEPAPAPAGPSRPEAPAETPREPPANRAPWIADSSPRERSLQAREGESRRFSARARDPDGDPTVLHWFVDGAEVARGNEYQLPGEDPGRHEVRVLAFDEDGAISRRVDWVVVVAAGLPAAPVQREPTAREEEDAVRAALEAWNAAINRHDLEGVAAVQTLDEVARTEYRKLFTQRSQQSFIVRWMMKVERRYVAELELVRLRPGSDPQLPLRMPVRAELVRREGQWRIERLVRLGEAGYQEPR